MPSTSIRLPLWLLLAPMVVAVGCGSSGEPEGAPSFAAPEVDVAAPLERPVVEWDLFTGRLEALEVVEVRARVSGALQSVHFEDGGTVREGDLLFVIDPRPYEAVLAEARAQVTRAEVRLELAENDLDRAERLVKRRAISEEEFDARTQEKREAEAALEAASAAVTAARLDVDFTRVEAPIAGRIGEQRIDPGNLVRGGSADSTVLATIVSRDPIHFYFNADEQSVLRYMRLTRAGSRRSSRDYPTPVELQLADERDFPRRGYIDFVDNRIDEATGTMRARARFENPDDMLVPGMFAKARMRIGGPSRALLIPDEAIQRDQAQRFVYLLGDGDVAKRRSVEIGPRAYGLRVVRSGLEAADRVLVAGLARVRPDGPVVPISVDLADRAQPDPAQDELGDGGAPGPTGEIAGTPTPDGAPDGAGDGESDGTNGAEP
ncbi:MAG: efflux RND transporter periplasmic adaptor subunit [Acidobacteriota bacterium]